MRNKILISLFAISVVAFFVGGSLYDSDFALSIALMIPSLIYIVLFLKANNWFEIKERRKKNRNEETEDDCTVRNHKVS